MTGAVLAGGKSSRMGTNKALLAVGGKRLIERIVEALRDLFAEVLVIGGTPGPFDDLGVRVVPDLIPEKGSLGGIYTAVAAASRPHAFVMACDMPFFNAPLVRHMQALAAEADIVIPRSAEGLQPLHAIYGKACLPHMEEAIRSGDFKITRFFPRVRVREVGPEVLAALDLEGLAFLNTNTPQEFAEALARWSAQQEGRCAAS